MELVLADGNLRRFSRDGDGENFRGMIVSLGALGGVVRLTLDVVPTFDVAQLVYLNLPLPACFEHFDDIMSRAYSVSLFTDFSGDAINQVWLKHRVSDGLNAAAPDPDSGALYGATPASKNLHPIAAMSAQSCTEQLKVPGTWHDRLPHFRMEHTPSSGEELQSEYLVPREHAVAALRAVHALRQEITPLLQISEIRTVAADELWMSPCYRRACVGIHFTWKKNWPAVGALLPRIEAQLAPFHARPHWGKLFTMRAAQLQPLYPRLGDFRRLLSDHDAEGKFRNPFLERNLFATE
jgi:xylitol oxidase